MPLSGSQVTRLLAYGGSGHNYGDFSGKSEANHTHGQITRLWPHGSIGTLYGDFSGKVASPPVFAGTIPDISHTENTGTHSYDLGAYFTGATSYSIAPAVETGWTFDTVTGELIIDTDALGVFGSFVVTGTNLAGSDDSNGFTVTVAAVVVDDAQPSGGWRFLYDYEAEQVRRREFMRRRRELEAETAAIAEPIDREIAELFRAQEVADEARQEKERLLSIARANADYEAATRYSVAVAAAYQAAIEIGTVDSIARLERELNAARAEEEFLMMALVMLSDG